MKIHPLHSRTLGALALLLSTLNPQVSTFAQGSLTPPGAPAPTMKSLDVIEPRTPIPGGVNAFTISTPGSYYLTGNLAVSGQTAISVTASDVTLDLNGFAVSAQGSSSPVAVISIPTPQRNLTIRGGKLSGNYLSTAIDATTVTALTVEDLRCDSCGQGVFGGDQMQVRNLALVNHQGSVGVSGGAGCSIRGVTVRGGASLAAISMGGGAVVEDCVIAGLNHTFDSDYTTGISVGNGGVVRGCAVSSCSVGANIFSGISTGSHSLVENCNSSLNSGTGPFRALAVSSGCSIRKCVVSGNSGAGIYSYGDNTSIADCTADSNGGDGIVVFNRSYVAHNTANANGNSGSAGTQGGIHANGNGNRIDSNQVFGNNCDGILVESNAVKNVVIRNTGGENLGFGYRVPGITGQPPGGANAVGPIVLDPTSSTANAWANIYQF